MPSSLLWVLFNVAVLAFLALDLGVFNRRPHVVPFKEAAAWSATWVALSLVFNVFIYLWHGPEPALQFLTGYVLEYSLSMDNVFVFAVIFGTTGVAAQFQHRVLFWGIIGALVMRGLFIYAGVQLVSRFEWVMYVFGAVLIISGVKLVTEKKSKIEPEKSRVLRVARRFLPVLPQFEGSSFFVKRNGRRFATPLFLVLVLVEATDVLFAVDSIPAIFAVTKDPLIIYTSNVCAILGLRAMYFMLAGAILRFRYLRPGLALILVFVGFKMLLAHFYPISTVVSLAVITCVVAAAIMLSLRAVAVPSHPVKTDK
ncbi:MAG TPA: TerC family protein [Terriglobia bacterium]|jgi:tellurite resistance protein TerC|nr:TerC family protein [Terriglobia bacterium]